MIKRKCGWLNSVSGPVDSERAESQLSRRFRTLHTSLKAICMKSAVAVIRTFRRTSRYVIVFKEVLDDLGCTNPFYGFALRGLRLHRTHHDVMMPSRPRGSALVIRCCRGWVTHGEQRRNRYWPGSPYNTYYYWCRATPPLGPNPESWHAFRSDNGPPVPPL